MCPPLFAHFGLSCHSFTTTTAIVCPVLSVTPAPYRRLLRSVSVCANETDLLAIVSLVAMHCISPLLLLALLLCYSATLVSGSRKGAHQLHFIKEPESQLSRADGSRINFICNAHPPEATIKWLRNGSIIKNDDYEWIKVNGNKLILQVTKSFHGSSPHNHSHSVASSNEVYQCLAELGNLRIVSQPAKLIIGELNAFESPENSQDKTLTVIAGNTAVVPCDLPPGVPFVISEFEFGNMTIATSYGRLLCIWSRTSIF